MGVGRAVMLVIFCRKRPMQPLVESLLLKELTKLLCAMQLIGLELLLSTIDDDEELRFASL
jgi:hypothetical protein